MAFREKPEAPGPTDDCFGEQSNRTDILGGSEKRGKTGAEGEDLSNGMDSWLKKKQSFCSTSRGGEETIPVEALLPPPGNARSPFL